ncbi:DUF7380 domain-containing protein [Inquilinus sp. OTU3971]|uniref:DUF7380 domain-containing protein n=1 Tax=Inquilinus sp. OTU3971 TaxID=3043855 RepID=UPI00313E384D
MGKDKGDAGIQQEIEEKPLWLQATVDDILDLDFEGPIADNDLADCRDLSRAYFDASKLHENLDDELAAPAARVFAMLSAVTDFHFKPEDRHAPYGAKMVVGDTRSSIPEDFRGGSLAVLADAAARTKNVVLRARLSDVCWLLERKRYGLGKAAVESYVEIVERLGSGQLKEYSDPDDDPMLGLVARDSLRRALTISRTVGWDSDEAVAARKLVPLLRDRAGRGKNPVPVLWFCEMDLDLNVSDPSQVAAEIEVFLQNAGPKSASHVVFAGASL